MKFNSSAIVAVASVLGPTRKKLEFKIFTQVQVRTRPKTLMNCFDRKNEEQNKFHEGLLMEENSYIAIKLEENSYIDQLKDV